MCAAHDPFLATFRTNRNAFNAIMVQNRGVPDFHAREGQATESAAAQLHDLLASRSDQITHPDLDTAADIAFRTLFALATQIVMMDESEVTGRTSARSSGPMRQHPHSSHT